MDNPKLPRRAAGWARFLTVALGLVVGCDSGDPVVPPEVVEGSLASIVITTESNTFTSLGESIILSASGRSESGSVVPAGPVTWTSSDDSIIEIRKGPSNIGGAIATARANGVATISGSSSDVVSTLDMTVHQRVGQIVLVKDDLWVERPGDSVRIESAPADARGNPMNAAVSWSAGRPDIATIDDSGLVSAVSFGETTAEARADDFVDEVLIKVVGDRFFRNGDVWLRYDVDLPGGSGPFPAIVWVHGSGRPDRNAQ